MIPSLISQIIGEHSKNAKIKKKKCIENGKVYYSFFKILGLLLISIMIGEILTAGVANIIFENTDTIDNNLALFIVLIVDLIVFCFILLLDKIHYEKLFEEYKNNKKS